MNNPPTAGTDMTAQHTLRLRRVGIDTYQEPVIYMRADCHVCRSEGFESQSRVRVRTKTSEIIATLNVTHSDLLKPGEAGLSEIAWRRLGVEEGQIVDLSHPEPVRSFAHVRAKLYGNHLVPEQINDIVDDIAAHRYSDVQLSAFVSACTYDRISLDEVVALTRAMVNAGQRLSWSATAVMDKHCVGGLPGNRTTPIIVPIVAACGITIPKTSSRAITSPAGTADTMETLAPVDLDLAAMRRVVDQQSGCIVWGGSVALSPADDVLIRIERALDVDSEAQLVASVLSKKIAAGATHVVIDIPVGPTAKVRDTRTADRLAEQLMAVGHALGLTVAIETTDGMQPVGRGIGPALEARDVLRVLQNDATAPMDLRQRAAGLAGRLLEIAGVSEPGEGRREATRILETGMAWTKFQAICEAQGGMREPPVAHYLQPVLAPRDGIVTIIDNRRLARAAKLAGAPGAAAAGVDLHVRWNDRVSAGEPLYTLYAETPGELAYALRFVGAQPDIVLIDEQDRDRSQASSR